MAKELDKKEMELVNGGTEKIGNYTVYSNDELIDLSKGISVKLFKEHSSGNLIYLGIGEVAGVVKSGKKCTVTVLYNGGFYNFPSIEHYHIGPAH